MSYRSPPGTRLMLDKPLVHTAYPDGQCCQPCGSSGTPSRS